MGSKREGGSDTIPTHTSRQWHHLVNMPDEHNKHECQYIPVMTLAKACRGPPKGTKMKPWRTPWACMQQDMVLSNMGMNRYSKNYY